MSSCTFSALSTYQVGGQRDGAPSPVKWLLVAVVAACGGCSAAYHPTDGANKMKMGKQYKLVLLDDLE